MTDLVGQLVARRPSTYGFRSVNGLIVLCPQNGCFSGFLSDSDGEAVSDASTAANVLALLGLDVYADEIPIILVPEPIACLIAQVHWTEIMILPKVVILKKYAIKHYVLRFLIVKSDDFGYCLCCCKLTMCFRMSGFVSQANDIKQEP